jgi:predicted component of type VI protein secretion system
VERPALKREVVTYIVSHYGLKLARACRLVRQVRSTQYLHSRKDPKLPLRQRLRELAQVRLRAAASFLAQEAKQDNHAAAGAHAAAAHQRCALQAAWKKLKIRIYSIPRPAPRNTL